MRDVVDRDDRDGAARPPAARPRGAHATCRAVSTSPSELAEVRIPIPDRPGAAAEVFTLAAELGVNIASFEVVHSVEGNRGVAVVLVDADDGRPVPRRSDRPRLPSGRATAGLSGRASCVEPAVRVPLDAVVAVPGSKSIANRALVCAALADGTLDVDATCPTATTPRRCSTASQALGVGVDRRPVTAIGRPSPAAAARLRPGPLELPTRLAGTTSRFITALAALGPGPYTVDGDAAAARAARWARCTTRSPTLGATVRAGGAVGAPAGDGQPVRCVVGAAVDVRGDVSSQFLTALMLIGPYVPGGLRLA